VSEAYQTASTGGPGANNWGCENANQSSRYVASIATNANGVVTVKSATGLGATADGKTITLTPLKATGALLTAANIPTQVGGWACNKAPGTAGTMPTKYLPGSCK